MRDEFQYTSQEKDILFEINEYEERFREWSDRVECEIKKEQKNNRKKYIVKRRSPPSKK